MFDVSKEGNRGFLRSTIDFLQLEVIQLRMEIAELKLLKQTSDDIALKLSDQLKLLRQIFFNNHREKMPSAPSKDGSPPPPKRSRTDKLIHNQSPLPPSAENPNGTIQLDEKIVPHMLSAESANEQAVATLPGIDQPDATAISNATAPVKLKCTCGCPDCNLETSPGWYEESAEIDVVKRRYIFARHRRQKYKGSVCGKIIVAPGPDKLVPTAEFSVEMAVEVAHNKFENHLPLERQIKDMKGDGLIVSVKTLYGLTEHLYKHLEGLPPMIQAEILSQNAVNIDESPMKFFNPKIAKGYVWSVSNNYGAFYQFYPNRTSEIAKELLKDYKGTVMSDAHTVYDWIDKDPDMIHVYCWAHLRSNFFKAQGAYPVAKDILLLIDELFAFEHEAKTLAELKIIRSEKSKKKVAEIEAKIDALEGKMLESSSIGKAVNYFNIRRVRFKLFLDNEHIPLSNNSAERAQRDTVMGRKNFTAYRSINGADVAMFFYTIFGTCKRIGINGKGYLLEQALRSIRGETLETPYQYGLRLREEIAKKLEADLIKVAVTNK